MLEALTRTWNATLKHLRRHPDPSIRIRARTILRNKMRLAKTPYDAALQTQTNRNLGDLGAEIKKQAH